MLEKKNLSLYGDFKERIIGARLKFSFLLAVLFCGYVAISLKIIGLAVVNLEKLYNKLERLQKPKYHENGRKKSWKIYNCCISK